MSPIYKEVYVPDTKRAAMLVNYLREKEGFTFPPKNDLDTKQIWINQVQEVKQLLNSIKETNDPQKEAEINANFELLAQEIVKVGHRINLKNGIEPLAVQSSILSVFERSLTKEIPKEIIATKDSKGVVRFRRGTRTKRAMITPRHVANLVSVYGLDGNPPHIINPYNSAIHTDLSQLSHDDYLRSKIFEVTVAK